MAELKRSLRLPHATALVVGTIVGSSVFVQASEVTHHVPYIPAVLLAWAVSGVLTMFGALACAELASAFPRTGGVYVFLRETYSPLAGFLWGWSMFWVMHSGIIAAMSVVFGRYAGVFVPLDDAGIRAVAVSAIVVNSAINYAGAKWGSSIQTAITAGKLLAVVAGLFAFGGWHVVTYTAEETVNPERTIPRALIIGIIVVTVCYVALNFVYFYVLPVDRVMASPRVAAEMATELLGERGALAISALVMFSVFGAMTGSIMAAPRVYFAMAKDGLVFRWFNQLHPQFRSPHRLIVFQAIWASVLVWTGTYRQLFSRVIFTEWIFFALMAGGIFILRKRADYQPAYRVWGYPWTPAVFVVASAAIVINRLIAEPLDSAAGLGLVALGIPVFYVWSKPRRSRAPL